MDASTHYSDTQYNFLLFNSMKANRSRLHAVRISNHYLAPVVGVFFFEKENFFVCLFNEMKRMVKSWTKFDWLKASSSINFQFIANRNYSSYSYSLLYNRDDRRERYSSFLLENSSKIYWKPELFNKVISVY